MRHTWFTLHSYIKLGSPVFIDWITLKLALPDANQVLVTKKTV